MVTEGQSSVQGSSSLVPNSSSQVTQSGRRDSKEQKVPFHPGGTRCFQGHHDQEPVLGTLCGCKELAAVGYTQVSGQAGRPRSLHGHRPSGSCLNSSDGLGNRAKAEAEVTE